MFAIVITAVAAALAVSFAWSVLELRAERRRNIGLHHHVERGEARLDAIVDMIRDEMRKGSTASFTFNAADVARHIEGAPRTFEETRAVYDYGRAQRREVRKAVDKALLERDRGHLSVVDGGDKPPPKGAA